MTQPDINRAAAIGATFLKPPLPEADVEQLITLFGHLKGIGLNQSQRDQTTTP